MVHPPSLMTADPIIREAETEDTAREEDPQQDSDADLEEIVLEPSEGYSG